MPYLMRLTMIEIGILYKKQNPDYFVLFIQDGLGINIIIDENYSHNIGLEKQRFKLFKDLKQQYIPDNGERFTLKQKRKILKFLFKEF